MAIVYRFLSSSINSSILRVAMGSRAEQGSSISNTSGSVAMARAMQRRCCCPPESESPLLCSLSLTSSQRAAPQGFSTFAAFPLVAVQAQAEGDVVVDARGERIGLLEDHADIAAHGNRVDRGIVDVAPAVMDVAFEAKAAHEVVHAVEAAQYRALAAPEGPMKAVMVFFCTGMVVSRTALNVP